MLGFLDLENFNWIHTAAVAFVDLHLVDREDRSTSSRSDS